MRKIVITLILSISLILIGCSNIQPNLEGTYQSEDHDGYIIQMAFQSEDNSFVESIENREVDRGTYEKTQDNIYKLKSDKQSFEVTLSKKNTFGIIINKINEGKPIQLNNIDKIPTYNSTDFDDVKKYEELLKKDR